MKRMRLAAVLVLMLAVPAQAAGRQALLPGGIWSSESGSGACFPVAAGYRAVCFGGGGEILTVSGAPVTAVESGTVEWIPADGRFAAVLSEDGTRLYLYEGLRPGETAPQLRKGKRIKAGSVVGLTERELLRVRLFLRSGTQLRSVPAGSLWPLLKERRSTVVYDGGTGCWAQLPSAAAPSG